jgi:hypothetical protein
MAQYREVIKQAESEKGMFDVDKFQQIHALHNLSDTLSRLRDKGWCEMLF